jgi:XTP/dITP diphosphohydrolase
MKGRRNGCNGEKTNETNKYSLEIKKNQGNKMKKIYFITDNKSKFQEARMIMKNINIKLIQKNLKFEESRSLDQEEVAREKARQAFSKLRKPVLSDDTGIYFEEYKIFPGTYTKFLFQAIGFRGVESLLKGKNRKAYFKTLICYKDREQEKFFSGVWKGKIVSNISKRFDPDWQYNGIFLPENSTRVLAEISLAERAGKSHRKKAFDKLVKFLRRRK